VATVTLAELLDEKVPLAPPDGAVKVTFTPPTGLPLTSVTEASNCVGKVVPTGPDWGVPATAVIVVGTPAALLVRANGAELMAPAVVAVTV
jgi:hypothetical protein